MKNAQLGSILRRDAAFVGHAVVSVVCASFASLALAATVIDLIP